MPLSVSASIAWGFGLLISLTPCQRDRDISGGHRDGRFGLVNGHGDPEHRIEMEASAGNSVGQGLDEVQWISLDVGDDGLSKRAVVESVPEIISRRRPAEVNTALHVDHKALPTLSFEVVDAMVAMPGNAAQ